MYLHYLFTYIAQSSTSLKADLHQDEYVKKKVNDWAINIRQHKHV